jgi:hypothetical protein
MPHIISTTARIIFGLQITCYVIGGAGIIKNKGGGGRSAVLLFMLECLGFS